MSPKEPTFGFEGAIIFRDSRFDLDSFKTFFHWKHE